MALTGIFVLTVVNVFGVKIGGIFGDLFTLMKLAGIIGAILTEFLLGSSNTTAFSVSSFGSSLRLPHQLFSFLGREFLELSGNTRHSDVHLRRCSLWELQRGLL